jgi:hypothetical protein
METKKIAVGENHQQQKLFLTINDMSNYLLEDAFFEAAFLPAAF